MYASFFGLNEKPFAITPDPRYLCTDSAKDPRTIRWADERAREEYVTPCARQWYDWTGNSSPG